MVGVAGRSKACHTCKQRRIACSLEKPHCVQCIKAGRQCAGYQKERVFIINGQRPKASSVQAAKPTSPSGGGELCIASTRGLIQKPLDRLTTSASVSITNSTQESPYLLAIKPGAAYRQQLIGVFNSSYSPIEMLGPESERLSWLMLLAEIPTPPQGLEKSTLAVCLAGIGRANKDPVLVTESLRLYIQGLQQLQKQLVDPVSMYKDETLGTCMALAAYELLECPANSKMAYVSHRDACARLIQLRGPEAHTSGLGHQLFLVHRFQGILKALENHQPTYLSEIKWKTEPWKDLPKRPFDELLDIFVTAPEIFQQADKFDSLEPHRRLIAVLGVVEQCWQVDERLQIFRKNLETTISSPLYWPQFSKWNTSATDPMLDSLFPIVFHFFDLRTAQTMTLYWAILTMLWSGMTSLYRALGEFGLNVSSSSDSGSQDPESSMLPSSILPPLKYRTQFATVASNVCQSVEYCMQEEMLALGPQFVVAPLAIVIETMREYPSFSREIVWAEEVLKGVIARGLRILKYSSAKE